jgi:hypothetical protein
MAEETAETSTETEEPLKGGDDNAYPWTKDDDEKCRAFIFELMANSEIDGYVLVDNMDRVYHWMRFNKKLPKRPALKPVDKES